MNMMDKIKSIKRGGMKKSSIKGIFHQFKDGDNPVRLVGEFVQVKTHFIAPSPKRKDRGLCQQEAFEGEDKLPQVVNCADWDINGEKETKEKTCVICKLNALAREMLKNSKLTAEDKEHFKALSAATYARTSLKWNILDRDDPYVVQNTDDGEKKILGLKISTIGMEAWTDIEKIFHQLGFDITDPVKGIDININKGSNGARVKYSANAIMQGITVKQTPMTEEELALEKHDLKKICGSEVDQAKVLSALHVDLRSYLEDVATEPIPEEEGEGVSEPAEPEVEPEPEPAPPPVAAKPKTSSFSGPVNLGSAKKKAELVTPVTVKEAPKAKEEDVEVNPEEYECFGTIDEKHSECIQCEAKEPCKAKKNTLATAKKGK